MAGVSRPARPSKAHELERKHSGVAKNNYAVLNIYRIVALKHTRRLEGGLVIDPVAHTSITVQ